MQVFFGIGWGGGGNACRAENFRAAFSTQAMFRAKLEKMERELEKRRARREQESAKYSERRRRHSHKKVVFDFGEYDAKFGANSEGEHKPNEAIVGEEKNPSLYTVLGVEATAPSEEIKTAYYAKAKK